MWVFVIICFLFIQTGNCEITKTKSGWPCVAYDGISAVCDYYGEHYNWCWIRGPGPRQAPIWDYCNDK